MEKPGESDVPAAAAPEAQAPETPSKDATTQQQQQQPTPQHQAPDTPAVIATPGVTQTESVDQAREQVQSWIQQGTGSIKDQQITESVKVLLKDYDSLKEKTSKLKALLGRSAKAQRETKIDLDATQKRLDQALREIDRLNHKIEKLSNRPTHMELLADFETNFDRALLSVGQQAGGQDTASPPAQASSTAQPTATTPEEKPVLESLLMQELSDYKDRIEKLENVNKALMARSTQLEAEAKDRKREREDYMNKISHLELEKRMAVMEAEHAMRLMNEKSASLAEMQMEIDLVTKASFTANARAAQGAELVKTAKSDRQHVQRLESQVEALQEWARASSEAKALAQDRCRQLEQQLRVLRGLSAAAGKGGSDRSLDLSGHLGVAVGMDEAISEGRHLFTSSGSLVIAAGDQGHRVITLEEDDAQSLKLSDRILMKWKFDVTPEDQTVDFSVLKGDCSTSSRQSEADAFIKARVVKGGAAGEIESAFVVQSACTLVWSNAHSWIKPRTIKYIVHAVVLSD